LIEFTQDLVSHLEFLKLPLKSLSFDAGFNTQQENFNRVLEIHSASLKDLSISRGPYALPFENLPAHIVLPELKSLTLCGPIFPSFNFLSQMPGLKSLNLKYNMMPLGGQTNCAYFVHNTALVSTEVLLDYWSLEQIQPGLRLHRPHSIVKHTNFEELRGVVLENLGSFSVMAEVYSGIHIAELGRIMPNLRSLHVGLENDGFEMVCRTWGSMESLQILPYKISEEGFLGVVNGEKYAAPNITDLKREKKAI